MAVNFKSFLLLLAVFTLSLGACRKKQVLSLTQQLGSSSYQVKISVTDEKTARVWKDTAGLTKDGGWEVGNKAEDRAHLGGVFVSKNDGTTAYFPSSLTANEVIERLTSKQDSNKNDALIKNLEIRYIDKQGKEVVLAKSEELQVGADFVKTFEMPANVDFTIEARGEQTGETITEPKENWWATGEKQELTSENFAVIRNSIVNNILKSLQQRQPQQNNNDNSGFNIFIEYGRKKGNIQQLPGSYAGLTAQAYVLEGMGKRFSDAKVSLKIEVLKEGKVIESKSVTKVRIAELTIKGTTK